MNPDDLDSTPPEALPDGVPASSRVLRLGYDEYDRTVSDLLHLEFRWSDLFPAEPPTLGAYDRVADRSVNERLLNEFAAAAVHVAAQVVGSEESFARVVGCTEQDAGCRDAFIDSFGRRAYRRPLTEDERGRLIALFDRGRELTESGNDFRGGVRLVIESVLQSAKFLYRAEQGTGEVTDKGVQLTAYEIAARLSYMFWGTMPDDELLGAAASGALSTPAGLEEQARRLVGDPRAAARVLDFHARWIQLADLDMIQKDTDVFPGFSEALVESMRAETLRFVEAVTLQGNGSIVDLLTAPYSYVDAPLAELYGLSGSFGPELSRVDFPAGLGRMGLLTQAAFLSGHSSNSTGTSPILRGVFVLERIACQHIPAPPPGAELEEPEGERPAFATTRDFFAWKTSMPGCANCHALINPVGFGFEQFDGIGRFRTTENGALVDSSGTVQVGSQAIEFENAEELIRGLSELGRVRSCYAQNWLNYLYGRVDTTEDAQVLARMTQNMATSGYGVRDLLITLTEGAAFTHLPPLAE